MDSSSTVTNDDIYELLKCMNSDIKNIKENIDSHNKNIKNLETEVNNLKGENQALKTELLTYQKRIRENNLLIFGIKEDTSVNIVSLVTDFIQKTLQVPLSVGEINDVFRIGNETEGKTRPILLQLVTQIKKKEIFGGVQKLKNTGIYLAHDLTKFEREKQRLLYRHFKAARSSKYSAKLTRGRLYINDKSYTYEDLVSANAETRLLRSNSNKTSSKESLNTQVGATQTSVGIGNPQLVKILKNISSLGNNSPDTNSQTATKQLGKQSESIPPISSGDAGTRSRTGSASKKTEGAANKGMDRKK